MTLTTGQALVDTTSRTHLLLAHLDLIDTLVDASRWLGDRRVQIVIGTDMAADAFGQAAVLTMVNLAVRASLTVSVRVENPGACVVVGPHRGEALTDALARLGAQDTEDAPSCVLGVGDVVRRANCPGPQVQVSWDGWVASIQQLGARMPERQGCILAPIAAGALAVSEVFHHFLGHLDAGWRSVALSLWDPLAAVHEEAVGPMLNDLPQRWMLVGLGHLGQAYAWCLGFLPHGNEVPEVWLVDDDKVSAANVSTGVLTRYPDSGVAAVFKTRVVSRWLEEAGFETRLIESRLPESYRWQDDHPGVALIGVDNFSLRRRLSEIGWPICIDAGLGSIATSFDSLSLHCFPGQLDSADVVAWHQVPATGIAKAPPSVLADLEGTSTDQCGVVMLAGQAVAAAFVGMVAGCLVVAEPLRRLAGGYGTDALVISLDSPSLRGARAKQSQPLRVGSIKAR